MAWYPSAFIQSVCAAGLTPQLQTRSASFVPQNAVDRGSWSQAHRSPERSLSVNPRSVMSQSSEISDILNPRSNSLASHGRKGANAEPPFKITDFVACSRSCLRLLI